MEVTARDIPLIRGQMCKATSFEKLDRWAILAQRNGLWDQVSDAHQERDETLRGLNGLVHWSNGPYHTIPVEGGYWTTADMYGKPVHVKARNLCYMHRYELVVDAS